jgi:hypothetical protein
MLRIVRIVMRALGSGFALVALFVACSGGSGAGAGGGTPCQQLQGAMCAQLNACPETAGSNECSYVDDDSQGSSRRGINCAACEGNFSRDICGDTTKTDDFFRTCLAAVNAGKATCDPNGSKPGEAALRLPPECAGFLTCGAGPCKS